MPKTLTLQEAAELLHMHPETLRQRAQAGEIRAAKPGRSWVFLEEDLLDYLRTLADTAHGERCKPNSSKGGKSWACTEEATRGTSVSRPPMVAEYVARLKRPIAD
jgi:excisionase family DNA binding protein